MKATILHRSVYHKTTEVEIEIPDSVDEFEVQEYLNDNEHLWVDKIDEQMSKAKYEYGLGMDSHDGWTDKDQSCEWRYEVDGCGGHL
jgi:hypothetical protein